MGDLLSQTAKEIDACRQEFFACIDFGERLRQKYFLDKGFSPLVCSQIRHELVESGELELDGKWWFIPKGAPVPPKEGDENAAKVPAAPKVVPLHPSGSNAERLARLAENIQVRKDAARKQIRETLQLMHHAQTPVFKTKLMQMVVAGSRDLRAEVLDEMLSTGEIDTYRFKTGRRYFDAFYLTEDTPVRRYGPKATLEVEVCRLLAFWEGRGLPYLTTALKPRDPTLVEFAAAGLVQKTVLEQAGDGSYFRGPEFDNYCAMLSVFIPRRNRQKLPGSL